MGKVLTGNFGEEDRSIENGTYHKLDTAEDSCELLINEVFNKALIEAQRRLGRIISPAEALKISSEITQEMSHLGEDIVGSPTEVDYDSSFASKIALFKQKLTEGRYKERLLEVFER